LFCSYFGLPRLQELVLRALRRRGVDLSNCIETLEMAYLHNLEDIFEWAADVVLQDDTTETEEWREMEKNANLMFKLATYLRWRL
jgi:hypothetical protein